MNDTTSREQILKRVRNAGMQKANNPYSNVDLDSKIYTPLTDDLEVVFAEELQKIGGHFVYCESKNELLNQVQHLIKNQQWEKIYTRNTSISGLLNQLNIESLTENADYSKVMVSLSDCEALVARLGSVLISSKQSNGRKLNFIAETQIIIAHREQLVETVKQALRLLDDKYAKDMPSMTTLITGPSRTADIEKTLVLGAHGPRTLIVFLTEEDFLND